MNLTKNLSFPKNYHIKERKVNSIPVFADLYYECKYYLRAKM